MQGGGETTKSSTVALPPNLVVREREQCQEEIETNLVHVLKHVAEAAQPLEALLADRHVGCLELRKLVREQCMEQYLPVWFLS